MMTPAERIMKVLPIGGTRKVNSLANSLRLSVQDIIDATYDSDCLDLLIGIRCAGGYADSPKSEWQVERYQ